MSKSKLEEAREKSNLIKNRLKMKDEQLKEDGNIIAQMIDIEKTIEIESEVEIQEPVMQPLEKISESTEKEIEPVSSPTEKTKVKKKKDKILMPYDNENKFLIFEKGTAGYYMYKAYDERLQQIADDYNEELKKHNSKSKVTKGMVLENILEEYFKKIDKNL